MSSLDPNQEKRKAAKAKSARTLDRLGVKDLELTEYEGTHHADCILPSKLTLVISL
jgi:hypothetical protein